MQELMMTMLIQGLLGSINWTAIVALAGGGMLAWKLTRDATRPLLVVALLALAVIGGGWWFWPRKAEKHTGPQEPHHADTTPAYRPAPPKRRQATPRPYARTVRPKKPAVYAEKHADGIAALAEERDDKAMNDPLYLDPKRREERHQMRMAKEIARRGSLYLVTAEDRKGPVTVQAYAEQRFQTQESRIARAQADLARLRQKYGPPTLIGGVDYERRYR